MWKTARTIGLPNIYLNGFAFVSGTCAWFPNVCVCVCMRGWGGGGRGWLVVRIIPGVCLNRPCTELCFLGGDISGFPKMCVR